MKHYARAVGKTDIVRQQPDGVCVAGLEITRALVFAVSELADGFVYYLRIVCVYPDTVEVL